MSDIVTTPVGRVSFPHVFKAYRNDDGKEAFEITLLFDKKEDLSELKRIVRAKAIEKWGDDKSKWPKNLKFPFNDGDLKSDRYPEYEGKISVRMTSNRQPGVVDAAVQPIMDQSEFYPGCYARCRVNAFFYDNKQKGVSLGLNHVQKVKDGEPLGGQRERVEEAFDAIEADDPDNYNGGAPVDDDLGI